MERAGEDSVNAERLEFPAVAPQEPVIGAVAVADPWAKYYRNPAVCSELAAKVLELEGVVALLLAYRTHVA